MMRLKIVCTLLFLMCVRTLQIQGAESIDLVLVATAPPLFTEARIREHFAEGLRGVERFGPL